MVYLITVFLIILAFREVLRLCEIWFLLFFLLLSEIYGITFGRDGQALEKVIGIKIKE